MIRAREIDPVVGLRLAALTDGEGCFYISAPRAKGNYYCSFIVKMREDDAPMLARYREGCGGIGRLVRQERRNGWNPTVAWTVQKKAEVGVIRDLFELYPLWSKKRREFEIWKQAVDFWMHVGYGTDWAQFVSWRSQLAAVRQFVEVAA